MPIKLHPTWHSRYHWRQVEGKRGPFGGDKSPYEARTVRTQRPHNKPLEYIGENKQQTSGSKNAFGIVSGRVCRESSSLDNFSRTTQLWSWPRCTHFSSGCSVQLSDPVSALSSCHRIVTYESIRSRPFIYAIMHQREFES